uniref:SGNH hydrolase-type esterase domain-containing protein n=1 Tax=Brassica oleracea var. oleracea TaxID=109376 RepID=A0A0D3AM15_BRAOL
MPANTPFLIFVGLLLFDSIPGLEAVTLASIQGVYVFGDSLADAGNNNCLPISVRKAIHLTASTFLAIFRREDSVTAKTPPMLSKFGLPLPPPYLSLLLRKNAREAAAVTGVSFASAGAGIFSSDDQTTGQAIPLSQQQDHWRSIHQELTRKLGSSKAQIHISKSLFVMIIGSNDVLDYYRNLELPQQINAQQYMQSIADKYKEHLKKIHETGTPRLLIFGVAQLGCTPEKREKNWTIHECNEEVNMFASLYNEALIKMLQQLKEELLSSMIYTYFDIFKSMQDINSNPAHYGLADATSACCGRGKLNAEHPCLPTARVCSDRTKYLFWDYYGHPTEAGSRVIADLMFAEDSQYMFPLSLSQLVAS